MWTKLLLVTALALVSAPTAAWAQACCAFGSSLTPTRLDLHERVLVGVQTGAGWLHGSHTPSGQYRGTPDAAMDVELRQTLFATAAIGDRVQASALLPWVETYRRTGSTPGEWGHGLGDVSALLRGELTQLHEYTDVPSFALLLGALFPTGTPAEDATSTLGSDTTGGGVFRALVGASVEQAFGAWLFNLSGTVSLAARADRAGITTRHAPRWAFVGSAGYAWSHHLSTAGSLSFETEGNTTLNDAVAPGTQKRRTELASITTYGFSDAWRMQFRLSLDPPVTQLGVNEPARLGGNVALIWSAL